MTTVASHVGDNTRRYGNPETPTQAGGKPENRAGHASLTIWDLSQDNVPLGKITLRISRIIRLFEAHLNHCGGMYRSYQCPDQESARSFPCA